jgi:hypothetical protein
MHWLVQDRLRAAFCGVRFSTPESRPMSRGAREFFIVDLRGLRAALTARARQSGMTESDVLRYALAVALGRDGQSAATATQAALDNQPSTTQVKLSIRLSRVAPHRLDVNARAVGLSRGAYLGRVIAGAPPVIASRDRLAAAAALSASAAELAVFCRDVHRLAQLLRDGEIRAAFPYRERLDVLDADVRAHLEAAANVLADLAPARMSPRRTSSIS